MISKLQCGAIYKQWCSKSTSVRPVQNTGSKIQCKLMTGPGACRTLAPLGNGHGGSGSLFLPLSAGRCCPSLGCREGQHPREGSTARGWMFWCGCWAAPLLVWDGLDPLLGGSGSGAGQFLGAWNPGTLFSARATILLLYFPLFLPSFPLLFLLLPVLP